MIRPDKAATTAEKLLVVIYCEARGNRDAVLYKESIAIAAYQRHPEAFGMRRHPHPSTAAVYVLLSKLEASGVLLRVNESEYSITRAGIFKAEKMVTVKFKTKPPVETTSKPRVRHDAPVDNIVSPYPDLKQFWTKVRTTTKEMKKNVRRVAVDGNADASGTPGGSDGRTVGGTTSAGNRDRTGAEGGDRRSESSEPVSGW